MQHRTLGPVLNAPPGNGAGADRSPPVVLIIAGSDSGGGAGIQADLKTVAAFGCHGVTAITALTAQNSRAVIAIDVTSPRFLRRQLDALWDDFDIAAVKIGMLANAAIIHAVVDSLRASKPADVPVVLDPVMVATSGDALLEADAVRALREVLIPLATLLTPNLPEAEALLGERIGREKARDAAQRLRALGSDAVLLKGGHFEDDGTLCDVLAQDGTIVEFEHPRLDLRAHGTGCTLASACAAGLARGYDVREAASTAVSFVHAALLNSFQPGRCDVAFLNHFAASREIREAGRE